MSKAAIDVPPGRAFQYICYVRIDLALVAEFPDEPLRWIRKAGNTGQNLLQRGASDPDDILKDLPIIEICRFRGDNEM
jgi:hypothetical protein